MTSNRQSILEKKPEMKYINMLIAQKEHSEWTKVNRVLDLDPFSAVYQLHAL